MAANPELLRDLLLFQGLDDAGRALLADHMEEVRFETGVKLFSEGDPGGICFVIRAGWVELSVIDEADQKLVISMLGPGELFGELSLFGGGVRSATAIALSAVDTVSLSRDGFLDFLNRRPEAALALMSNLVKRIRDADALLKQRVQDPNLLIEEKVTFGDRLADNVAAFGGSWRFVISFTVFMAFWTTFNAFSGNAFDPFPFILLNLGLSGLAALQAPFIMMSQNRQDAKDRIRADADYHVNVKAEAEIIALHEKVDRLRLELNLKLENIARRLPK
ncbi:MAG: DUF1003 domain-containing protein [Myxococcota bacterium]